MKITVILSFEDKEELSIALMGVKEMQIQHSLIDSKSLQITCHPQSLYNLGKYVGLTKSQMIILGDE